MTYIKRKGRNILISASTTNHIHVEKTHDHTPHGRTRLLPWMPMFMNLSQFAGCEGMHM